MNASQGIMDGWVSMVRDDTGAELREDVGNLKVGL